MKFYNPYQFIPFKAPDEKSLTPYADIKDGKISFIRHDRWDKDAYSGRIICKLTTISPLVVGEKQDKGVKEDKKKGIIGKAGVVHPYRDGQNIPANSLRGMLASIAEMISHSSMRVLSDENTHTYSVRKIMQNSLKTIGRRPVGNLYHSIADIDKNLLPWDGDRGKSEGSLTPAEALFGVVEDHPKEVARNLGSRLRFYDATAEKQITLEHKHELLKILASPQPPSPSMYFHTKEGGYIAKSDLDLGNKNHIPNGRKRYLAHPDWQKKINNKNKWETQHDSAKSIHQKLKCQPIPANACFWFHIDFENLSKDELNLLRTAINPGENFQHQLGLGKPLGLGQITVKETALFLIDRKTRYSQSGLFHQHYSEWSGEGGIPNPIYPKEAEFSKTPPITAVDMECKYTDPETIEQLNQLGHLESYEKDDKGHYLSVCYPFTESDKHKESESYKHKETEGYEWFCDNDKDKCQYLREILPGRQLPPLDSDTNEPDISPPASMNQQTLKIGGIPPKNKRDFNDKDVQEAVQTQLSILQPQRVNLEKGLLVVEISPDKLQTLFNQNDPIPFTVKQHEMTLRQQPS